MSLLTTVSSDQFDMDVLKAEGLTLVDFYADWCSPCKAMMPALEDIAREYEGELRIVKVNTDEAPELAARYGVASIPSFLVVKNGEVVDRFNGTRTRSQLAAIVEKQLETD